MPRLVLPSNPSATIELGEIIEAQIVDAEPGIESRFFLCHERVLPPRPFAEWGRRTSLLIFPEAPGRYDLLGFWRSPDGTEGRFDLSFTLTATAVGSHDKNWNSTCDGPTRTDLDDGASMWSLSGWESGMVQHWEGDLKKALEDHVRPGFVVYDIGANMGFYSRCAVNLVGETGHVYGIEANPVCVYFLRCNLGNTNHHQCTIIPVALSDGPGSVAFKINFGNSNLGLTNRSVHFSYKMGQEVEVSCIDFDSLTRSLALRPPDLIKIDIEGAEAHAIRGMSRSLEQHRPTLLMEIHDEGAAMATYDLLDAAGYRSSAVDGNEGDPFDREAIIEKARDGVFRMVAKPAAL